MFRYAFALFVLVTVTVPVCADEVEGIFVKYDKEKKVLILKIEEEETPFQLHDDTKVFTLKGEMSKRGISGLTAFKIARPFKLKTEIKDGKLVVVEVRPVP